MIERKELDARFGNRLRFLRTMNGISQEELGNVLGLTFQQIQKYEKGANRISMSVAWHISIFLGCSISHFFGTDEPNEAELEEIRSRSFLDLNRLLNKANDKDLTTLLLSVARKVI